MAGTGSRRRRRDRRKAAGITRPQQIIGTLLKGTLYRVEQAGDLSEKKPLDRDRQVEYVGRVLGLRCYLLVEDRTLVYVDVEDDLSRAPRD